MKRTFTASTMNRGAIALTAALATIATAALLATSGSAQGPAATSLHLVGTDQKGTGFGSHRDLRPGDRFAIGHKIKGDDTGIDRAICTYVGKGYTLCTNAFRLSKGTLYIEGLVQGEPNKSPYAVTGGTGAYDGARGTAIVTAGRAPEDIRITLRP
ncbi:MAG: hypothetical protein M3N47_11885 [Chloroflexota bacterium]|nr:hypothetical protein [Chloroflexota bacterium]